MGTVIQFKQAGTIDNLSNDLIDQTNLMIFRWRWRKAEKAIGGNMASIDKDVQAIESIICNTEDPELRDRLLSQLKAIHDQLLIASADLLNAKRLIQDMGLK